MPKNDDGEGRRELPPRLRIMILGNSTALVVGRKRTRADGSYGEVLERKLRARGIDALIDNQSGPWEMLQDALPRFMASVSPAPDVVILNFGLGECEPNIFPRFLMRLTNDARYMPSFHPVARRLRKIFVPRINKFRIWVMPRIMPRIGMRTWRLRPRRFEAELVRLLIRLRTHTAGLVLLLSPNPPTPIQEKLMPGFTERAEYYTTIMRDVVSARNDPLVRIVEAGTVVETLGWRNALFDGIHYSAEAHAAVADLLEDDINGWLAAEGSQRKRGKGSRSVQDGARAADLA